jgi:hypothetical protein
MIIQIRRLSSSALLPPDGAGRVVVVVDSAPGVPSPRTSRLWTVVYVSPLVDEASSASDAATSSDSPSSSGTSSTSSDVSGGGAVVSSDGGGAWVVATVVVVVGLVVDDVEGDVEGGGSVVSLVGGGGGRICAGSPDAVERRVSAAEGAAATTSNTAAAISPRRSITHPTRDRSSSIDSYLGPGRRGLIVLSADRRAVEPPLLAVNVTLSDRRRSSVAGPRTNHPPVTSGAAGS